MWKYIPSEGRTFKNGGGGDYLMTLSLFRILMPSYWKDIKRRERDSFPGSLFRFQFVFWKEKKLLRLYFNITEKLRVTQYYIGSVFLYVLHLILKRRDRVSSASVRKKNTVNRFVIKDEFFGESDSDLKPVSLFWKIDS